MFEFYVYGPHIGYKALLFWCKRFYFVPFHLIFPFSHGDLKFQFYLHVIHLSGSQSMPLHLNGSDWVLGVLHLKGSIVLHLKGSILLHFKDSVVLHLKDSVVHYLKGSMLHCLHGSMLHYLHGSMLLRLNGFMPMLKFFWLTWVILF